MCGILGLWCTRQQSPEQLRSVAERMADSICHRGPDDSGVFVHAGAGVALGHRRLSIVDLSAAGHQPMTSASSRYIVVFNGEIYNHLELRAQLGETATPWRGHSDTETLLAGIERWGLEYTLKQCVGMFALALWDTAERTLSLARDRFGEKPLYYGWTGTGTSSFVFGSELKALRAYPGFTNPVCREALADYLRLLYVPAPRTIHQDIFKLEPGCLLTIHGAPPQAAPRTPVAAGSRHGTLAVHRWYALQDTVADAAQHRFEDEAEALYALEEGLGEAVRLQSLADVPLGAFLSGGVDSATIVALMQRQSKRPVQTFTVGFEDAGFDESPYARAVAAHLGTDHQELFVTADEARAVIPRLPAIYDEPFADSSQIPTHLVCRVARQHVTVALSGDAGDELFGGYNRYFWAPRIWSRVGWMPSRMRQVLASGLRGVAPSIWDRALGHAGVRRPGEKLHKLGAALRRAESIDDLYRNLVSEWARPEALVVSSGEATALSLPRLPSAGTADPRARMMFWDALTYLPDDILCKLDRASMATSLETRVPFLDHRVVELAWRLPISMKTRGGQGKWALRQILYRHVPRELIERPKSGFAIPIGSWLRGPLRDWAENLLHPQRLRAEGYLRPEPIRAAWEQHLTGRFDRSASLWSVLMFQAWLDSLPTAARREGGA